MRELTEWARTVHFPNRPWLVLGKGPTFARRHEFDLSGFNTISLNHAVLDEKVDIAHLVDVDVAVDCGDLLAANSDWVVMPRHPHVDSRPSVARLEDFVPHVPVLRSLEGQGRLIWYNAATGPPEGGAEVLDLRSFSAEAALGVAAILGAKTVRSLGVDGGRSYSPSFQALNTSTLLRNGQPSFNAQFTELDRIAAARDVDFAPLLPPLRIFIGADPTQRIAAEVLEHSLQAHASVPIRVDVLDQPLERMPRDERNRPRTPFSFNRFRIPALTRFTGKALYLDSDMLVFGDVAELFELPFDDHIVLCSRQGEAPAAWRGHPDFKPGRQFSVMLIDCERARWDLDGVIDDLDAGRYSYAELMFDLALVRPDRIGEAIPGGWNHLERYEPGVTRLLHFTVVPTQPWRTDGNPLRQLWLDALERASAAGAVDHVRLRQDVSAGHVVRDLMAYAATLPDHGLRLGASPVRIELQATRERLAAAEAALSRQTGLLRRLARRIAGRRGG